jgi:hypothetical protein
VRDEEWLGLAALGLVGGLLIWQRDAIIETVVDIVNRGDRLTFVAAGDNGQAMADPGALRAQASLMLGREITQDVYSLARMIRSEGAAQGRIRAHVAMNDAHELGWSLHQLITYSTNNFARGLYGQQYTPAANAPAGIASKRRYASTKDPHAGDVEVVEAAIAERAAGVDPTGGGVKFVDKSSMGVQTGSGSYAELVKSWAADGLRPFTLPGGGADLVVFRRVG